MICIVESAIESLQNKNTLILKLFVHTNITYG